MLNLDFHMHQSATYWPPGVNDGFGGTTFAAPRTIRCRWQDEATMFRDAQGRETVSQHVVYPAEPLALGGYLYLGTTSESNPRNVTGAAEIRQVSRTPNLGGTFALNKAML